MSGAEGEPPPPPAFLADAMLGSLARWLRVLGFDAAYRPDLDDRGLVARAVAEGRILLTRDRRLTQRRAARRHLLIRAETVEQQLREVLAALGLRPDPDRLLSRCLRCNRPLVPLPRQAARSRVPPYVFRTQERFRHCPGCGRIFWRATHVQRMLERLRGMGLPGG